MKTQSIQTRRTNIETFGFFRGLLYVGRVRAGLWHGGVRRVGPVLCLVVMLTGCGNGLSSVSGTLTLDGKPLAGSENVRVMVMFYPESGSGAPAAAMADESGEYFLSTGSREGVVPGDYVVTVSGTEFTPSAVEGGIPARRELTAPRYANPKQSGMRVTVEPGRNTFDFDLQSS